jgi:(p)ppGpp synthase/HD superfamily hydrolase
MDGAFGTRFHDALRQSAFPAEDRAHIARAEALMRATLGRAGPRKDGSSAVDHTMRVATNVIAELGVMDADLVIAALLHDVVEDASEHFAPGTAASDATRDIALREIGAAFGPRVARAVALVTLPDIDALARERIAAGDARPHETVRNAIYADKIARTVLESTDAFAVKLADFLDNGVRVDPVARPGLAVKYRPLFTMLPDALMALPAEAPLAARRDAVIAKLNAARERVYGA